MPTACYYLYQDELVRLAATIPDWKQRDLFLDTVANNANLHAPAEGGRVWVRIPTASSDARWIEDLARDAGMQLTRIGYID
jgi:hypothetical protein